MNNILQLKKILKNNKSIYIQTHNFPDPDAIGSAFGLQYILKHFNIKSKIIYSGYIANKTVMSMINQLHIKVFHISQIRVEKIDKIIVVDTKVGASNITALHADYIGYIDHHESKAPVKIKNQFFDLQKKMGACSSIIGQYIYDLQINKIPKNVATALLIGVYIDTFRFSRKTSPMDISVASYLFPFADFDFLSFETLNVISMKDLKSFSESIRNLKQIHDMGIIHVSKLNSHHLLAILCDFFIQMRELNLIIGYCIKKKDIAISVRCDNTDYNALRIVNEITSGIGVSGGHSSFAAGMIDRSNIRKNFNFERHLFKIVRALI